MRHTFSIVPAFLLAAVATAVVTAASAQSGYPRKPILMMVPLQAASAVDNAARIVAARMSENMGQQIVIENQPGAAGLIGTEKVAKAAPDGYTIGGFNDSIMTMLPNLYQKMSWDVLKDFEPVSLVSSMEWALVAPPSSPFATAADVVAAAKARPGELNFSSGGNGSPQHIAMEVFKARTGVFMAHIPYRGAMAAALDVASGQVQVHFSGMPTVYTLIKGGKLKILGVASPKRSPLFPDVPTISESGVPGFEFGSFFAIVAPVGTPREIVARLNAEVVKATNAPDVRDKLVGQGFSVVASSPEALNAATRDQLERYGKLFKRVGIKAE